ncbi:V4R domain-containing protein [Thermodesulfobacteriota bacterium]
MVSVKHSVFAEAYGSSEAGVCHLIRGVMGGMASSIFKENCVATEIECASKGDDRCTFHAKVR